MPVTSPTAITALPSPPDPNNRSTFNSLAYPWSVALSTWTTQTNSIATVTYNNAVDAANSAATVASTISAATASATAAAAASASAAATSASAASTSADQAAASAATAGAIAWVSGTTYAPGAVRYSPINFQAYRRTTNGAGTTDPSLDSTNWVLAVKAGITQVTTATTATTLTNTPTLLQITPTGYGVTVTLPNATTCSVGGPLHCIDNRGEVPLRLVDSTAALVGFVPPKSVCYISLDNNSTAAGVWATGLPKVGCAAATDLTSPATYNGYAAAVSLDSDRTFLSWSTGTAYYACVYRQSTNTFSAPTLIRTVATATFNAAVLCGTNAVLMVTCPSGGTAIQGVVLSINASTDAITVNTAANATAAAAVNLFGPSSPVTTTILVAVPGASGSYVLSYWATNGYIQAFSVSGTTVTIGSATTLGGNGGTGQSILASGDKVIAVSYGTTTGYFNVYTISGTTITAGTGGTVGSVQYPQQFLAWGSRWLVLWLSNTGTTITASLLSLSGTTLTASTVTGVAGCSSAVVDVAAIGSTKMLVTGNSSTGANPVNILTDTAGTLSAGTPLAGITGSNQRAIAWVSGTDALVVEASVQKQYLISCSGASPTLTRTWTFASSCFIPYITPSFDDLTYAGVKGSQFAFGFNGVGGSTQFAAADGTVLTLVPPSVLPQNANGGSTYFGYRNKTFFFATSQIALLECVA